MLRPIQRWLHLFSHHLLRRCRLGGMLAVAAALTGAIPGHAGAADIPWIWLSDETPSTGGPEWAVLVNELRFDGERMRSRRRFKALLPAAQVLVTPVVHVNAPRGLPARDPASHLAAIREAVIDASAWSSSGWVQLDYEPHRRDLARFTALVAELRTALPASIRLSITAIASRCRDLRWIDGLRADELVPMFFRMGQAGPSLVRALRNGDASLHARCRAGAAGFAALEPVAADIPARYTRRYWFNLGVPPPTTEGLR